MYYWLKSLYVLWLGFSYSSCHTYITDWYHSHTLPATLTSQTDIIQVALITNGVLSFVDLLYLNPETWKLSDSIQMGLNSGLESDSFPLSYFTLPNMPSGVDNVWGNTGAPGEWFFRVDTAVALQPQRMLLILATFIQAYSFADYKHKCCNIWVCAVFRL